MEYGSRRLGVLAVFCRIFEYNQIRRSRRSDGYRDLCFRLEPPVCAIFWPNEICGADRATERNLDENEQPT